MSKAERRVLDALSGGCVIAYADGGPRIRGGYRKGAHWLIGRQLTLYGFRYEATRIADKVMSRLQGAALIYDYGDFGLSPAGREWLRAQRAGRSKAEDAS